jgi:hypothetical protein
MLQVPDRGPSGSDNKKKNLLGDPLHDIKHYLDMEKVGCNSRKHENRDDKRKCRESEKNEIKRVHKKSKNKMGKERGRRRTESSSSSKSECDTVSEVSKLLLSNFKLWYLGLTASVV